MPWCASALETASDALRIAPMRGRRLRALTERSRRAQPADQLAQAAIAIAVAADEAQARAARRYVIRDAARDRQRCGGTRRRDLEGQLGIDRQRLGGREQRTAHTDLADR